jgi:hypothetical protein
VWRNRGKRGEMRRKRSKRRWSVSRVDEEERDFKGTVSPV